MMTAAPIPPAVIDGGLAAVGLLARLAACKYLDHLSVYRIEQIAARQGVPLARSTLAEWIERIDVALQPLADRLAELLRQRDCLHADETPVRQLDPANGKTHHAYLWACCARRRVTHGRVRLPDQPGLCPRARLPPRLARPSHG
jgi:transposase-like protein